MPLLLDSKPEHYSSTTAHRASFSCQRKATERSENATSSRSTITDYHAYQKYTECLTDTSVFRTSSGGLTHHSHDISVVLAILLLKKPSKMKYYKAEEDAALIK